MINAFLRKKLPPSVAVLYDDLSPYYQVDPTTAPYWTYLEQQKFLHTRDTAQACTTEQSVVMDGYGYRTASWIKS